MKVRSSIIIITALISCVLIISNAQQEEEQQLSNEPHETLVFKKAKVDFDAFEILVNEVKPYREE
ncbi:MAG: hypothetical protein MRY83_07615, partial [Flavobacteriales bacterium]|nr:hypothetical protein [Flavobacteriales bacterium]